MHPLVVVVVVGIGVASFLHYIFAAEPTTQQHAQQQAHQPTDHYMSPDRNSWENNSSRSRRRRSNAQERKSVRDAECSICLNDFASTANNDMVTVLKPCGHKFHTDCIAKWRRMGPTDAGTKCPNCRSKINLI